MRVVRIHACTQETAEARDVMYMQAKATCKHGAVRER